MKKLTAITTILLLLTQISAQAAWTYVENEGNKTVNGQNYPYTGTISDGNWEIYVYRPVEGSDEFYLGTGGSGYGARVAGSGSLDLSTLYADTLAAGTPVKIVNVAKSAFYNIQGNLTELYLPNTVTNIGPAAFEYCNKIQKIDLSNTKIRSIHGFAFSWAQNCSEIWLPETLEYIGACAFRTMPRSGVVHFLGDVPHLEKTAENNIYGTQFWAYITINVYQNILAQPDARWAFCVNAEKYPNWKHVIESNWYNEETPFPSNEINWIPQSVRYTVNPEYGVPFGNTAFTRTTEITEHPNNRSYLIQEGTNDGVQIARPYLSKITSDVNRYAITNTIPVFVGTGTKPVTVTYTFNGNTQTIQLENDTVLVFPEEDLEQSSNYEMSVFVEGSNGFDEYSTTLTTLTPEIVLGDFSYELTKDGKTSTFTFDVDMLRVDTGTLSLYINGVEAFTTNIVSTGTYTFVKNNLELNTEYVCQLFGEAGIDSEIKELTFIAERYKWTYTYGPGKKDNCPYTGIISDKNWKLYVYQPDEELNDFYLGCGGNGTSCYIEGSEILDLTQVLDDTTLDGYPVNIVNVADYAMKQVSFESITLPNNVTNIGIGAFSTTSHKKIDLSNTKIRSIQKYAFEWNQSLNEVWLPKTLKFLGQSAFITLPNNGIAHFLGDVPELELTTTSSGSKYHAYLSDTMNKYTNFAPGNNDKWAFCVDNKLYPAWNTCMDTTLYTEEEPFPTSENNWIPEAVRYTVNSNYKVPFAKTKFGRQQETGNNSRTYLIYEKHGELATILFIR